MCRGGVYGGRGSDDQGEQNKTVPLLALVWPLLQHTLPSCSPSNKGEQESDARKGTTRYTCHAVELRGRSYSYGEIRGQDCYNPHATVTRRRDGRERERSEGVKGREIFEQGCVGGNGVGGGSGDG